MGLYVGIDGGGSKTQVFLMDMERRIGITCIGKASNPNTVPWDAALETMDYLIHFLMKSINASDNEVLGLSFCLAGLSRSEHIEKMKEKFSSIFTNALIEVSGDALAALTAGTFGTPGVVLIAGTGSVCLGETETGEIFRAGGYGNLVGDEGSGFDIGRSGIIAAIQSAEHRGTATILWQKVQSFYQIEQVLDIVPAIYGASNPIQSIASFARIVIESSPHDLVSNQIINKAVDQYIRLIQSVYIQINHNLNKKVVLSGSIFTKTTDMRDLLQQKMPDSNFLVLTLSPAAGAVLRAIQYEQRMRYAEDYSSREVIKLWEQLANKAELLSIS